MEEEDFRGAKPLTESQLARIPAECRIFVQAIREGDFALATETPPPGYNGQEKLLDLMVEMDDAAYLRGLAAAGHYGRIFERQTVDLYVQACRSKAPACALFLARRLTDRQLAGTGEGSAVGWALYTGSPGLVRGLAKLGFSLDGLTQRHDTPALLAAASRRQWELLETLLECGANPAARDRQGRTLLHRLAGHEGIPGIADRLLATGHLPLDVRDEKGTTPAMVAASEGRTDILEVFWKHGFDEALYDERGRTVAHHAAMSGNIESVRFCAEAGLNLEARDFDGRTPILAALSPDARGSGETSALILDILHRAGARLEPRDVFGENLAHLAVRRKNPDVAVWAARQPGLDWRAKNQYGWTPVDILDHESGKEKFNETVLAALTRRNAVLAMQDPGGPDDGPLL
jgi:ankyrin repeat protein